MALASGFRLGSYDIVALLGQGGMGEVYRARDTNLPREVALKILPEVFANDADRVARFRREAELLASLNHPHIGAIYGLNESGGRHFLVLELVEGGTLADRLRKGALPAVEALAIARQLAAALEAAHEKGIVHRDLKPANIGLTGDEQVKVLDFGLAKAAASTSAGAGDRADSPTVTSPAMLTATGVILGTAAYMSPEQARGRSADKRSDLWAFGAILYEMLTGRSPFEGEGLSDTLALVLTRDPDWSALPPDTTPGIRRLLRRCLERDRRRRLADAGEAALQIEEAADEPSAATATSPGRWRARLAWTVACVLASVGGAGGAWWWARLTVPAPVPIEARIELAAGGELGAGDSGSPVAISPDGRLLAFVTRGDDGALYLRRLDQLSATPVPETVGALAPFFSPDSRWVGFFADGKLKKVAVAGGFPTIICDAPFPKGGTWTADGTIVFSPDWSSSLLAVSSDGGTPATLTTLSAGERSHSSPVALSGGRVVLFTSHVSGEQWNDGTIESVSLETKARTVVYRGGAHPRVRDGLLFVARRDSLHAVAFDETTLAASGTPRVVLTDLMMNGGDGDGATSGVAQYDLSATGTLVARTRPPGDPGARPVGRRLILAEATGPMRATSDSTQWQSLWHFSPDGTRILGTTAAGQLAIFDTQTGTARQLTFGGDNRGAATWTPDGRGVVFLAYAGADTGLYWMNADGSRRPELLARVALGFTPSFTPDGRTLLFQIRSPTSGGDLVTLRLDGPLGPGVKASGPHPYIATTDEDAFASLSPDGHWVAFARRTPNENFRVHVSRFPSGEGLWLAAPQEARVIRWSADGRRIFARDYRRNIVTIPVETSTGVPVFGPPATMFTTATNVDAAEISISPEGRRVALLEPTGTQESRPGGGTAGTHVTLAVGWTNRLTSAPQDRDSNR